MLNINFRDNQGNLNNKVVKQIVDEYPILLHFDALKSFRGVVAELLCQTPKSQKGLDYIPIYMRQLGESTTKQPVCTVIRGCR